MRSTLALAGLALVLSGCASIADVSGTAWSRPGMSIQEVTQDEMECARLASEVGWTPDLVVGGVVDAVRFAVAESRRDEAYRRCMVDKGYHA